MKKIFLLLFLTALTPIVWGQKIPLYMPVIHINEAVTTFIISGEPIRVVDISTNDVVGNQPLDNVLRLKPKNELTPGETCGIVTIITEREMTQYKLVYTDSPQKADTEYIIRQEEITSYLHPEFSMSKSEMYQYAWKIMNSGRKYHDVSTSSNKMVLTLNNIYTIGDYFFLDITLRNKSNIKYDIDEIRFKIEDKKQTKATNFQSIEIEPVLVLNPKNFFRREYRNVFVLEKFTFPDEKVLNIEFSEKQISGRPVVLRVNYADVLHADSF